MTKPLAGRSAAFFDLDRTLLPGGSGPVFAETLARLGVKTPHIPGQEFLFKLFDLLGESYIVMQLARQSASRAKGLDRAMVQAAAEVAADTLLERVQPYVPAVLEAHRRDGELLVLATTSPFDLVSPFARRLGFDAVVATRYAEQEGVYTGEIDGRFVWGPGKLAAITDWAKERNIDLSLCAAYSDSVFDTPMLSAVGRPVAVNPDYRLRLFATAKRWPIRSFDVPDGVPAVNGVEPFDFVRNLLRPEFFPTIKFSFEGLEHMPRHGGAIIAANHRSYFDPLAIGLAIAKAGRNGRFMGKKEVFDAPIVGQIAKAMGAIRVDRGTGSSKPLDEAAAALDAGEIVVILPQGTIPRGEQFFEPELLGKSGVARLAAMTGAPVIPLGVWGTERVWPRSSKVPNLLQFSQPPEVTLRFGSAVELTDGDGDVDATENTIRVHTKKIMQSIMDLLPPESRVRRVVSEEELAKTQPNGKKRTESPKPQSGGMSAAVETDVAPTARSSSSSSAAKSKAKAGGKSKSDSLRQTKKPAIATIASTTRAASSKRAAAKEPTSKKLTSKKSTSKKSTAKKNVAMRTAKSAPGTQSGPPSRRIAGDFADR
jgi:putative phosphoserine phosphatase / 1-acylglycerol-3-phosphate O-acyltransferase